jgi:hypothetical protein
MIMAAVVEAADTLDTRDMVEVRNFASFFLNQPQPTAPATLLPR